MKAFIAALIGIVAISIIAKTGLDSLVMSARETHAMPGVSLPAPSDRAVFQ